MQLRAGAAAIIYMGSYFPLSLVLLCQNFDTKIFAHPICNSSEVLALQCELPLKNPIFATSFLVGCSLCFFVAVYTLHQVSPNKDINVVESKYIPADLMSYVLPYIVSFMSLDYQDPSKFVGFSIFLLWIFWITYKSGLIILNPIFVAFGWKLYEIKYTFAGSKDEFNGMTLSNDEILPKRIYKQETIQDILIIKI